MPHLTPYQKLKKLFRYLSDKPLRESALECGDTLTVVLSHSHTDSIRAVGLFNSADPRALFRDARKYLEELNIGVSLESLILPGANGLKVRFLLFSDNWEGHMPWNEE